MTKKSNSFKNIISVFLALLLLGIAAAPASAALNTAKGAGTIVVAGANAQNAFTSANVTTILQITGGAGDIGISSEAITITIPSGTGVTFNTSFAPTLLPNTSFSATLGTPTISTTKIAIPATGAATALWGINVSNVYVDVAATASRGNIVISVSNAATTDTSTVLTVAKPTVRTISNYLVNIPFGAGNATVPANIINISTTTGAVGEIGALTYVNLTLPTGTGLTFATNNPGNVTFPTGAGGSFSGSTMANVSSGGTTLSAIVGSVSNGVNYINFTGFGLNATTTAFNGTVGFNVTLGNSTANAYTLAVAGPINLTKPVVSLLPVNLTLGNIGQINAPLGNNNVSASVNNAYINISYSNTSVAGELAAGSRVSISLPSDSGITFTSYNPGNATFGGSNAAFDGTSFANVTGDGLTLWALVAPNTVTTASTTTVGYINFTGFGLNVSTNAVNGTKFNVTTTPINASGNVTTQIPLGINTTNVSISLTGTETSNTIYVDANGNTTASLGTLAIRTTAGVVDEIGASTNITISLPTYTGVSFNVSNTSVGTNTIGNVTSTNLFLNFTHTSRNFAIPTVVSGTENRNLTVLVMNSSVGTQSVLSFSGYTLNISSSAPAGRLNFTVVTTANGTNSTSPNGTTASALTQTNTTLGITIKPVWADVINNFSSNTNAIPVGNTSTFNFKVTNLSTGINFSGSTVSFGVNTSAASLSTTSATTDVFGNVSVNVTAPGTLSGFNLTVNITGPASFVNATNRTINVTIQATALTTASKLAIITDTAKIAPSQKANITVVATDTFGNNVSGYTNSILLAAASTNNDATVSSTNPVAMVNGVAYFNLSKTTAGNVTLTATDQTGTLTYATATQVFTVDPVSVALTAVSSSVVSNGSAVNLTASLRDASGNVIQTSGQSITITSSNTTLGGINSATASSVTATTNSSGFATANFTANSAGTTGTAFANASYTNASGYILRNNVSISVTTGTPSTTTSTLNLTTTGSIAAGSIANFSATIKDSNGNAIPSQAVTFSTTTGGSLSNGTASGSSVVNTTNSTGVAVVTLTTNTTVGINTVRATTSTGDFNQSVSLTTVPGPAAKLAFTSATPSSIGVGLNGTLEVQLQDSNGNSNTTSGVTVNFTTSNSAAGTLSASSNTTNAAGIASVVLTGSSTGGTTVITALSTGLTSATKTITVQAVSQIVLTASKSVAAANGSDTISITAQLADASGAPLNISGTIITYTKSGVGNLSVSQGSTNSTGANVTAITSGTGGSATVNASASGVPPASVTVTFSGNATAIIVTASPSSATVNNTIAVRAQAIDSAGNNAVIFNGAPITGFSVTFSPSSTALTVSNASTAFNATGGASANVTSGTAAAYTVTVSGAGLANTTSVTFTPVVTVKGNDTLGIYQNSTGNFFLKNSNSAGAADSTFQFGPGGLKPLKGDYDGSGNDTAGVYNLGTGTFFLKNSNTAGPADTTVQFGPVASDLLPVIGDWDGSGTTDTIGLYNTTSGTFYLKNSNSAGAADTTVQYGSGGSDFLPVVGDWDGSGNDTIGLYKISTGTFYLKNSNTPGPADTTVQYGSAASDLLPVIGDWDGSGNDTIGLYNTTSGTFFLKNTNSPGPADTTAQYGSGGSGILPVVGDWDGQ